MRQACPILGIPQPLGLNFSLQRATPAHRNDTANESQDAQTPGNHRRPRAPPPIPRRAENEPLLDTGRGSAEKETKCAPGGRAARKRYVTHL